jgi:sRNA-binding regulator protein Hfq
MRRRPKKRNNFIHFKRRLRERYNISIRRNEYDSLCRRVKNGIYLGSQRRGMDVYQVNLRDQKIIVIYNPSIKTVLTLLYPGGSYNLV